MQYRYFYASLTPVFLLTVTVACGGEDPELALGWDAPAIVNGTKDTGHTSVGRIAGGAEGHCTATLIGPRTLLTAAHCLTNKGPGYIVMPISFSFSGLDTYDAESAVVHPSYGQYYFSYDIGVVRLKQVVTKQTPSPLASAAPKVGQKAVLVGYGITGTGKYDSGVKRVGTNTISYLNKDYLSFSGSSGSSSNLCSGDSGGPSFGTENGKEVIIGVHSTGSVPCGTSGNDMRVDIYRDWIIKSSKGDVGNTKDLQKPTVYILSPTDYDVLETAFKVRVQASDNVGVVRVELKVDNKKVAQLTAPPFEFSLKNVAQGSRRISALAFDKAGNGAQDNVDVIVTAQSAKAAFGAPCTTDTDCKTGLCVDRPSGTGRFCTDTCDPADDKCPEGYSCQAAGGRNVCMPPPDDSEPPTTERGCAVGHGSPAAGFTLLLLLLLAIRRRR